MVGTVGAIIITILVLAAVGATGWVLYSRWRAQKLGLPPPSFVSFVPFLHKSDPNPYGPPTPAPGGIVGWFNDQVRKIKERNNRTAAGAYEGGPSGGRGRRGFGPLDPDEAWDARVGNEADNYGPGGYYEEQELGLHEPAGRGQGQQHAGQQQNTAYGSAEHDSYSMNLAATPQPQSRGYGDDRGRTLSRDGRPNPFDDDAAEPSNISLRGVSPRPIDGAEHGHGDGGSIAERKSIFRENV
ncbi:hypothetical protein VP1G_04817 [Cytospora mali]|uniref:Acid phosphatase-like protein n=1 Tax=Cytospora mali TaxID=578113 RepID=A0A194V0T1_CYTMA|nr:hypothetical protein VP1G_04817 [Valsa mali var. pyri (nom. inval.)]